MAGATALIGAATQALLAALVLVLELTHTGIDLMIPMLLGTAAATAVTRYLDGYSIYTARLPAREPDPVLPAAPPAGSGPVAPTGTAGLSGR